MNISCPTWICAFLFFACTPKEQPILVLQAERIEVAFNQQKPDSIRVYASETWHAESSAAWCQVEVFNDSTLYIHVDPCTETTKRQTIVHVLTPQRQAQLLVIQGTAPGGDFLRYRDSLALEAIYHAGNGPAWKWRVGFEEIDNGWDRTKPFTQWLGVGTRSIDGSIRVQVLDLRSISDFSGPLSDSAALLNKLSGLYLKGIPLTASPLKTLAKLDALEALDISYMPHPLVWPQPLGGLKYLTLLYASGVKHPSNRLGTGWNELNRLQWIQLAGCGLEGGFPQVLLDNSALEQLDLSDNPHMGGEIPTQIARLGALEELDVSMCGLTGTLPAELGELTHLVTLKAAINPELGGAIPAALGRIPNLQTLNIADCAFTVLPIEVWNCANLQYVNVAFNQLEGSIPVAVSAAQHLGFLGLTGNKLSGAVPAEVLACARWKKWYPNSWICPQQTGYGFTNCNIAKK